VALGAAAAAARPVRPCGARCRRRRRSEQTIDRRVRQHVARLRRGERDLPERHLDRLGAAVERHARILQLDGEALPAERQLLLGVLEGEVIDTDLARGAHTLRVELHGEIARGAARANPRDQLGQRGAHEQGHGEPLPGELAVPDQGVEPELSLEADRAFARLEPEVERERRVRRERYARRLETQRHAHGLTVAEHRELGALDLEIVDAQVGRRASFSRRGCGRGRLTACARLGGLQLAPHA
jgi:hypothetical protein